MQGHASIVLLGGHRFQAAHQHAPETAFKAFTFTHGNAQAPPTPTSIFSPIIRRRTSFHPAFVPNAKPDLPLLTLTITPIKPCINTQRSATITFFQPCETCSRTRVTEASHCGRRSPTAQWNVSPSGLKLYQ